MILTNTTEIQVSFATFLDAFEPSIGQPTDKDLTRLEFSTLGVLAFISFDEELGKHNLMGLMIGNADYKAPHSRLPFPDYNTRSAIYDDNIKEEATAGVCVKA